MDDESAIDQGIDMLSDLGGAGGDYGIPFIQNITPLMDLLDDVATVHPIIKGE